MNDATDRLTNLTADAAQTMLDSAYLLQRQQAQFYQTWLTTLEANQQTSRELVSRFVRQSREAQSLWVKIAQDAVRTSTDTMVRAADSQLHEASEQLDRAGKQVNNGTKRTETAATSGK